MGAPLPMLAAILSQKPPQPVVDYNFASGAMPAAFTTTRAGATATRFNSAGVLEVVPANTPRIDYDPATLVCLGLLVEEQRTNSVPNSTATGATAGNPGTVPTGWVMADVGGVVRQVVGTGVENGIAYCDVRYSGTATSTASTNLFWVQTNVVAAATGQTWSSGVYTRLVAGSMAGVALDYQLNSRSSGNAVLDTVNAALVPTGAPLANQKQKLTLAFNTAGAAFASPRIVMTVTNGAAVDITLRIAQPGLELGAFCTSDIPTTTAAVTRNADVPAMNGVPFFNAAEGTLVVDYLFGASASTAGIVQFDDGSANNRLTIADNSTGIQGRFTTISTGGTSDTFGPGWGAAGNKRRQVAAYKVADTALSTNAGGAIATGAPAALPVGVNRLVFGTRDATISGQRWISRFRYYNRRVVNQALPYLSAA